MNPLRVQVKFFLDPPDAAGVDVGKFTPVFQGWIQEKALEGQLIDVADYRHVQDGPGIVLIGHDSDYSMERRDGRLGLLYTRKRHGDSTDLLGQLRASLRLALTACQLLQTEPLFTPRLKFSADEVEIRFPDRLQLPNKPETFDLVKQDIRAVLDELYGEDAAFALPVRQDSRYVFTVRARAEDSTSINKLLFQAQAVKS
jgi:hypothetical protein